MHITFLGVGEAFDVLPNTSQLLECSRANILFDCGYSMPPQWFKLGKQADFLDAIYISHRHADHCFGLPAILLRMDEEGRKKPLVVICQESCQYFLRDLTKTAYPNAGKLSFPVEFVGVNEGTVTDLEDLKLRYAESIHSIRNLAVRVSTDDWAYCYSGDGQFTIGTQHLYRDSDLLVHETFLRKEKRDGHACVTDVIAMAEQNGVKALALTHLDRKFRESDLPSLREEFRDNTKMKILIPEPMDEYHLPSRTS